jgi:hypothetical protein
LAETNDSLQFCELFISAMGERLTKVLLLLGAILLFGDAPFARPGCSILMTRTSKKRWLAGQIIYLFLLALIYLIFILAGLTLFCRGHLQFGNQWSELYRSSTDGFYVEAAELFPTSTLIHKFTPYVAFGIAFLLAWLFFICIGMLWLTSNLYAGSVQAAVIMIVIISWDYGVGADLLPGFCRYISISGVAGMEYFEATPMFLLYQTLLLATVSLLLCYIAVHRITHIDLLDLEKE